MQCESTHWNSRSTTGKSLINLDFPFQSINFNYLTSNFFSFLFCLSFYFYNEICLFIKKQRMMLTFKFKSYMLMFLQIRIIFEILSLCALNKDILFFHIRSIVWKYCVTSEVAKPNETSLMLSWKKKKKFWDKNSCWKFQYFGSTPIKISVIQGKPYFSGYGQLEKKHTWREKSWMLNFFIRLIHKKSHIKK